MYWEAAQAETAVKDLLATMVKWDKELTAYEKMIEDKKEQGENVAGMLVNFKKGEKRYNQVMEAIEAMSVYTKKLQEECEALHKHKVENVILKQELKQDRGNYRRIMYL